MKRILSLLILSLSLSGCGTLVRYPNGRTALFTQADAEEFEFIGPGISLRAKTLIHSDHTEKALRAGSDVLTKGGVGGGIMAVTGGAL